MTTKFDEVFGNSAIRQQIFMKKRRIKMYEEQVRRQKRQYEKINRKLRALPPSGWGENPPAKHRIYISGKWEQQEFGMVGSRWRYVCHGTNGWGADYRRSWLCDGY